MGRPKKDADQKCIRKDITMDPEQYSRLVEYCRQSERPMSWVIRKALDQYMDNLCINTY